MTKAAIPMTPREPPRPIPTFTPVDMPSDGEGVGVVAAACVNEDDAEVCGALDEAKRELVDDGTAEAATTSRSDELAEPSGEVDGGSAEDKVCVGCVLVAARATFHPTTAMAPT